MATSWIYTGVKEKNLDKVIILAPLAYMKYI